MVRTNFGRIEPIFKTKGVAAQLTTRELVVHISVNPFLSLL